MLPDVYIKVFKKNKQGLKGKFKLFGQVVLGVFVGTILFFHPEVKVRTNVEPISSLIQNTKETKNFSNDIKAAITTIPLLKNNEFI